MKIESKFTNSIKERLGELNSSKFGFNFFVKFVTLLHVIDFRLCIFYWGVGSQMGPGPVLASFVFGVFAKFGYSWWG